MSAIRIQNQTLITDYITRLQVEEATLIVETMLDEYTFQFENQESCDAEFCRLIAELNAITPPPSEKIVWLLIYHDDSGNCWHKLFSSHEEAWRYMVDNMSRWILDYDEEMWYHYDEEEPFEPAIKYGVVYLDESYDYGWAEKGAWFNYSDYPQWVIYEEKVVI